MTVDMIGTYQHNIDRKGRVIMPAKFREKLGDVFYATKGTLDNISVLSETAWEELCCKINALPSAQTETLRRYLFSNASELVPDKQGRILIPRNLREHAHLTKEVILIGAGSKVEIWDLNTWNDYNSGLDGLDIMKTMQELGL